MKSTSFTLSTPAMQAATPALAAPLPVEDMLTTCFAVGIGTFSSTQEVEGVFSLAAT